jgi:hypothetical protein
LLVYLLNGVNLGSGCCTLSIVIHYLCKRLRHLVHCLSNESSLLYEHTFDAACLHRSRLMCCSTKSALRAAASASVTIAGWHVGRVEEDEHYACM